MVDEILEIPELADIEDVLDGTSIFYNLKRKRTQRYDPFASLSDEEFRRRYRLTKNSVKYVVNLIEEQLKPAKKSRLDSVSPSLQVLITLRYYAKGSYQTEVGDIHLVDQSTVSRIIEKVSNAIASLLPQFIKFPNQLTETKLKFYQLAGFPNVVGSIDCTHIRIRNPRQEDAMLYCNRKGFYSINVQVVCDADCKILDIVARWRGSVHDARIWSLCSLKEKFEAGTINGILLGDGGYPCSHYLLTPILNPSTAAEEAYNSAHKTTRNTIERCFGQWKGMFRALYKENELSLSTVKTAIVAMAVLYNIKKIHGEEEDYSDDDDDNDNENIQDDNDTVNQSMLENDITRGRIFRQQFIRNHFT